MMNRARLNKEKEAKKAEETPAKPKQKSISTYFQPKADTPAKAKKPEEPQPSRSLELKPCEKTVQILNSFAAVRDPQDVCSAPPVVRQSSSTVCGHQSNPK